MSDPEKLKDEMPDVALHNDISRNHLRAGAHSEIFNSVTPLFEAAEEKIGPGGQMQRRGTMTGGKYGNYEEYGLRRG